MNTEFSELIITHPDPVWRIMSNFVFHAHIGNKDGRNEWEQLWGMLLSPSEIMICCIPFFLYDISLGDIVTVDNCKNLNLVAKKGDHKPLRIWFEEESLENREYVLKKLSDPLILKEFHSKKLPAISIPQLKFAETRFLLQTLEDDGVIQYEVG